MGEKVDVWAEFEARTGRSRFADWQTMDSAPRDGTPVELTWMENGKPQEIWPMRWCHIQRNEFFAPGKVGMWTLLGGGLTWNDDHPDGAPTHWRPYVAESDPGPRSSDRPNKE